MQTDGAKGLCVVVAAHREYPMPQDAAYLPVQAGAAGAEKPLPYQSDAQGENISRRNDLYCELTALYWAWKNLPAGALGLVHYRRHFGAKGRRARAWQERIASGEELTALLARVPVILPEKRNYYIDTRRGQFIRAHGAAAYDALREALRDMAPAYLPAFDRTMARTSGHCFNMFVMRRDWADAYCAWLFPLLFETEARMRAAGQDVPPRMMGYLAERMLDSYVETNGLDYAELPVVHTEGQDWLRKGAAFLARRLRAARREA